MACSEWSKPEFWASCGGKQENVPWTPLSFFGQKSNEQNGYSENAGILVKFVFNGICQGEPILRKIWKD